MEGKEKKRKGNRFRGVQYRKNICIASDIDTIRLDDGMDKGIMKYGRKAWRFQTTRYHPIRLTVCVTRYKAC